MAALSRLRSLWRNLVHRDRVERELDDEMRATFDQLVDEKIAGGMKPWEARRQASLDLGGVEPLKERVRDAKAGVRIESVFQDFKFAFRHMRRSPGFAGAAIATLALGIGANTAMFSVLNAIMFRTLPVPDPGGLYSFTTQDERGRVRYVPYTVIPDLAEKGPFKSVCGYNGGGVSSIDVGGATTMALTAFLSGGCFDTFGVVPFLGRPIVDADAPLVSPGNHVAVISHRLWTRMFNADPAVIGRTFKIETIDLTVIGVTPEGFGGLHVDAAVDIFIPPDTIFPAPRERRPVASEVVGRLRDGVTLEQADAQITTLWPGLRAMVAGDMSRAAEGANLFGTVTRVRSIATGISSTLRDVYGTAFELMAALTALLLILACINVGGLLLTRLTARTNELSVRLALGGTRLRIAQQMLTESLVLSGGGALLAVPLSFAIIRAINIFMPQNRIERTLSLTPDARVLSLMALTALVAAAVMTALPIWVAMRQRLGTSFTDRTVTASTSRLSRGLLVAQVSMSMVLLAGAGLLVRSLYLIQRADLGVVTSNVVDFDLFAVPGGSRGLDAASYYPALIEHISSMPGVRSVGMSQAFPRQRFPPSTPFAFAGEPDGSAFASSDSISPGLFATIGVPILAGRDVTWADTKQSRRVCLVNDSFARALSPDGNVLNRRVRFGTARDMQDLEIVGIVGNTTMGNLRVSAPPIIFSPALQAITFTSPNILVAAGRDRTTVISRVRELVREGGHEYVREVISLDDLFARAPASERMTASLAALVGLLAVVLAAIGIHGVLAYSVSRRTREIGLRLAVGATPQSAVLSVLREGFMLTATGVIIGVPVAFAASRSLRALVFGVSETDPLTFLATAVFFLALGLAAGVLPARRAASVDPVIALRTD